MPLAQSKGKEMATLHANVSKDTRTDAPEMGRDSITATPLTNSNLQQQRIFLDAHDAAALLNISAKTLLRWARLGIVPAHPLSGTKRRSWRFVASELDAWALSKVNLKSDWCQNSRRK
jgi:hypothetical protein